MNRVEAIMILILSLSKEEVSELKERILKEATFETPSVNDNEAKKEKCYHPLPYRKPTGLYTSGYTCTLCGKFESRG